MASNGKAQDYVNPQGGMLIAAIEQAKQELRDEFDQDMHVLATAVFGTTDLTGRLLKPGLVQMFNALDNTIAFLCEKAGVKPEDITRWLNEKAALAAGGK